jgi:outer membrane protein assembly factor BamB
MVIYYDRRSASRVFTYESPFGLIVGTPIVIEDNAYAVLGGGRVIALQLEKTNNDWEKFFRDIQGRLWLWGMAPRPPQPTGLLWGYAGPNDSVIAGPAAKDGMLYYGTVHGDITALDLNTQQAAWTFEGEGAVRGAAAVVNDTVYISSGHYVYALSAATGEKVWEFRANGEVTSDIVVTRDALYFADDQSNLYALN